MSIPHPDPSRVPPPSARPPLSALTVAEVVGLHDELRAYHQCFAPLFQRAEQRNWALKYLEGQLLPLDRKSIEPMADALAGGNVQAMQQFISEGAWDDEVVLHHHQEQVAEALGDPDTGVLIIDGCDFPKQGTHSVGVARQWCGALGKVANCQASVVAAYASARGYTLVDRRLYLPETWFSAEDAARRQRCGVPLDLPFQTRTELAWAMIAGLRQRRTLPFRWVVGDEQFGNHPDLLDQIAAVGLCYLMEVPRHVRVWPERPPTAVPPPTGRKGRPFTRPRLTPDARASIRVDALATSLPPGAWHSAIIQEGSKGPFVAEVACRRVVAVRDGLPGPDIWVILRRGLGEEPDVKIYLCNAPADLPQTTLIWLLGRRWPVEQAIKESKDELGMDQYEVRGWRGWHHHLTMTLLAHHFLMRLRSRLGGDRPGADCAAGPRAVIRDAPHSAAGRGDGPRAGPGDPAP